MGPTAQSRWPGASQAKEGGLLNGGTLGFPPVRDRFESSSGTAVWQRRLEGTVSVIKDRLSPRAFAASGYKEDVRRDHLGRPPAIVYGDWKLALAGWVK
jgi:hypothetical protein